MKLRTIFRASSPWLIAKIASDRVPKINPIEAVVEFVDICNP